MEQPDIQNTDEQIAKSVQGGDTQAFSELMMRYEKKMLRYSRKFLYNSNEAEDVVQEVFLKAYRNIQSFDAAKKFSSWIYRIAHNEFINALKRNGKIQTVYLDPEIIFPHPVAGESTEAGMDRQSLRRMLETSLDQLSAKYREPLVLYYFEELSYEEIADVMHMPVSTVGVRIKRGKDALKTVFEKLGYKP